MSELITKLNPALVVEAMQAPAIIYKSDSIVQLPDSVYKSHIYDSNTGIGVMLLHDSTITSHRFYQSEVNSVQLINVTEIGGNAFYQCTSLTSITIPNSVTSIAAGAFDGCTSLTSIDIPDSVPSIGMSVFRDCVNLTDVTIGKGVTSITGRSFYNCTNLINVYCKPIIPPQTLELVSSSNRVWQAFDCNAPGRKIYVPIEAVDAYKSADGWKDYADQIVGVVFEDEALESGINVKTINGQSILGEGNIDVLSSVNIATSAEIEALFTNTSSSES